MKPLDCELEESARRDTLTCKDLGATSSHFRLGRPISEGTTIAAGLYRVRLAVMNACRLTVQVPGLWGVLPDASSPRSSIVLSACESLFHTPLWVKGASSSDEKTSSA